MSTGRSVGDDIEVSATNIGGIDDATVSLRPGVNVLEGRNATNRTSLLQAIMAALGSDHPSLKGDADEGRVDLSLGAGETATRELRRHNGQVVFDGDPYLADSTLADLFAFLLESNEARRTVERGDDLREVIMRPVDTDEINARIESLEADKREVDDRLAELDRIEDELPELEERRTATRETIEAREAELAELQAEIAERDADVAESQDRRAEIEDAFDRLREARRDLEDLEFDLETERETARELEAEREDLEAELEALPTDDTGSADELEGRLSELRERKRALDSTVSELQSVIRFNEDRLEEGGVGVPGGLADDQADGGNADGEADAGADGTVTDRLVETDTVTCWTCGSPVGRERIQETLEQLRSLHREKLEERNDLAGRIDEVSERLSERRDREQRRERLEDRIAEIDAELAAQESRVADLEAAIEAAEDKIAEIEAETEAVESDETDYEEVLSLHREASQVELELDRHREDLADVEDRIAAIESQVEEREDLEARRDGITDELTDLRTRVDRIEAEAVEAFNEHMAEVLGILEYANLDRVWIERTESTVREGRRTVTKRSFDLHVVRTTDDGSTYEDTVAHLSESEREVTGLVFALAGYLVHEVHETVPFVLLDSLEAIDSERIADLVAYFADYAECLVVALLPEDAAALPDSDTYHTEF